MSWYLRDGLKPKGPFPEDEIKRLLLAGELSPEDLIWKDGPGEWKAALMWPEFRALSVPAFQEVESVGEDEKEWVVLQKREGVVPKTTGPWSLSEIRDGLARGEFQPTDHLWKKGMSGWSRLESRPELSPAGGAEERGL